MEAYFITIAGAKNYYGLQPFKPGVTVKLEKDKENKHDGEAIRVTLPYIDTVGYVANSTHTVYDGTHSAGRLYDKMEDYAYARVMFVTHSSVIAMFISAELAEKSSTEKNINVLT